MPRTVRAALDPSATLRAVLYSDPLGELHAQGGNCPAAQPVRGATDAYSGCICGVMLNDSRRMDSILEGAPIGVYIAAWSDPSTLVKWCFGDALPVLDPDGQPWAASYTTCPIWLAEKELQEAQRMDRLFGGPDSTPDIAELIAQLREENPSVEWDDPSVEATDDDMLEIMAAGGLR